MRHAGEVAVKQIEADERLVTPDGELKEVAHQAPYHSHHDQPEREADKPDPEMRDVGRLSESVFSEKQRRLSQFGKLSMDRDPSKTFSAAGEGGRSESPKRARIPVDHRR